MRFTSTTCGLGALLTLLVPALADESARIITFLTRKAGMTEQEFHDHWTNTHGPLVVPWALQYGVNRYTQYHTTEANRTTLQKALRLPDEYLLQYDGAADFTVSSIEQFLSAYADPYYKQVIEPDEKSLFAHSGDVMVVRGSLGWTTDIIENGGAVVDVAGGCSKWREIHGSARRGC
ncbi:hypothetical protein CABS01_16329 [Colletotrichum abscissum]|uniref:EthD domain-containing protein n=1 Tax=Colletotrichum abscissum TaxID=1671311 RepID=A0A9P9XNK0_9PEZI|nr:uncharacterized protein CABS01_16329 [Colletotrichum abscissum]KAI3557467.1 hypothetical protein CABS02_02126 [Colletotrichum abscissum]KAK1471684.1 hypothetical protein CABS01_16329 [Colletotrichum abscissum]